MIKKAILLVLLFMGSLYSYSRDDANNLLNRAKSEAKYLYTYSIKPKKNSDDEKYVCITYSSGKKFVDRKKIALDLFEGAAKAGSGEAAYILFCYNWIGRYENQTCFQPNWDNHYGDLAVDMCFASLQRAADLGHPKASEFLNYKNDILNKYRTNKEVCDELILLYEAIEGNPTSQMWIGMKYRDSNPTKYEYWIKKSISNKNWPLLGRADYAFYLLDLGRHDEAMSVLKPIERKKNYYDDITARRGIKQILLFYIAECLYANNISGAIENCDNLYKEVSNDIRYLYDDGVIDKFVESHGFNYMECCVNHSSTSSQKRLLETIYVLNKNPENRTILHNRGIHYETFGDSIQAFRYYKEAALKHYKRSICKVFDYATRGYKLSDLEIADFLSLIITSEDKNKDEFTISGEFADWKIYYILAEYFYKSENRDYQKAVALYWQATKSSSGSPEIIKGECARQLSKCYAFGRGVTADDNKAREWLEYAKRIGDYDAMKIYEELYNDELSKN